MGVMDSLATEHGDIVQAVMGMQTALEARQSNPPGIAEFERMGYLSQHVEAAYAANTPPAGIFGVGVAHLHDRMRPAVFVMSDLMTAPVEMFLPNVLTPTQQLVAKYMGATPFPSDLVLVGIPPLRNFCDVRSGSVITIGDQKSTLGVPVVLAGQRRGYLTAGHGARNVNDQVLIDGTRIGEVVFSSCRERALSADPVADVAAIALDPAIVEAPTGAPRITQVDNPLPQILISMRRADILRRGRVFGLSPSFAPDAYASWAEVILCSPISAPGDSGSAIVRDDNTSACIGQVVGGAQNYVTVVQQLQYLLDSAGVTLRG